MRKHLLPNTLGVLIVSGGFPDPQPDHHRSDPGLSRSWSAASHRLQLILCHQLGIALAGRPVGDQRPTLDAACASHLHCLGGDGIYLPWRRLAGRTRSPDARHAVNHPILKRLPQTIVRDSPFLFICVHPRTDVLPTNTKMQQEYVGQAVSLSFLWGTAQDSNRFISEPFHSIRGILIKVDSNVKSSR